jgi:hypothetical protein
MIVAKFTWGAAGNMGFVGSFHGNIKAKKLSGCTVELEFTIRNVTSASSGQTMSHTPRGQTWKWTEVQTFSDPGRDQNIQMPGSDIERYDWNPFLPP